LSNRYGPAISFQLQRRAYERDIWRKAHSLVLKIYGVTGPFPKGEIYGLVSQLRRAAASVPTNIAEGCGRGTDTELARFLEIAAGSASELEYLLLLAGDLKLIQGELCGSLTAEVIEVKRMLASLIKRLRADP
jgi:four helix bundle protein